MNTKTNIDEENQTDNNSVTPEWIAGRPASECSVCGSESILNCYIYGLYDGKKQSSKKMCRSCASDKNEELRKNQSGGESE